MRVSPVRPWCRRTQDPQILLSGLCIGVLGVGNFVTLGQTLYHKRLARAKRISHRGAKKP